MFVLGHWRSIDIYKANLYPIFQKINKTIFAWHSFEVFFGYHFYITLSKTVKATVEMYPKIDSFSWTPLMSNADLLGKIIPVGKILT